MTQGGAPVTSGGQLGEPKIVAMTDDDHLLGLYSEKAAMLLSGVEWSGQLQRCCVQSGHVPINVHIRQTDIDLSLSMS